jgi:hypothetical protein
LRGQRGTQGVQSDNTVTRGQTEGRNTYDTVKRGQRGTQGVQSNNTVTRGQTEGRNTYDTVMRGQRGTQGCPLMTVSYGFLPSVFPLVTVLSDCTPRVPLCPLMTVSCH